jgi:hypothetical protein
MHRSARTGFALLVLLSPACVPEYEYVPKTNATADVRGETSSDYPIPPGNPRGDVQIASFGIAGLMPASARDEDADDVAEIRAIHLRFVVANQAETAESWTLDTGAQRLHIVGRGDSAPAFASVDVGPQPPSVTIPPSARRTVDVFFPLGLDQQDESDLPEFDVTWTVRTEEGLVTERTPFERVAVEPPPIYYDYGAPRLYDPSYPQVGGFYGSLPSAYLGGIAYVRQFDRGGRPGYPRGWRSAR